MTAGTLNGPVIHRGIASTGLKAAAFVLVGLNSLAVTYYFYYLYFYTKAVYHFDARENYFLAAALGLVCAAGSFFGGRFAQRFGYFCSIRVGGAAMAACFLAGSQV